MNHTFHSGNEQHMDFRKDARKKKKQKKKVYRKGSHEASDKGKYPQAGKEKHPYHREFTLKLLLPTSHKKFTVYPQDTHDRSTQKVMKENASIHPALH